MTTPPMYAHQVIARDHLLRTPRGALFVDMGLGKTRTVLEALTPDHLPALVVAPKRVAEEVWSAEQERWRPELSLVRAIGSAAARKQALTFGADITVISRDNLADALTVKTPWRTFVIDELSGYKGRGARWRTASKVEKRMHYVWGLTGTPAPNGYLDLWPQVALLDRGERLGKNITTYRGRYFTPGRQLPNGVITQWYLREEAEKNIWAKIEDICLSMTAEGRIDLPPLVLNPITVELPTQARQIYDRFKKDLVVDLAVLGGVKHSAASAGVLTNRLSQIAAGFLYADEKELHDNAHTWIHREKVEAAQEVVASASSPVLVFYRFKPELDALRAALPGSRNINEPDVIRDWNAGRVPVLLAHPQSAAHGLNLQAGGHNILWTSLPWSLEEWQQANARLARPGQESHHVLVHMLMAKRTVDAAILDRLQNKTDVQDTLREALESPL